MRAVQLAVGCLAVAVAGQVQAGIIVTIANSGPNVVVSSSGGNVDTTGLSIGTLSGSGFDGQYGAHGTVKQGVFANTGGGHTIYINGTSTITETTMGGYTPRVNSFGGTFAANEETVVLQTASAVDRIWLTNGSGVGVNTIGAFLFTSNSPTTIAALGLTDGSSITYDWGNDFITWNVGATATVPEPTSLALLATGAFGFMGYGWRRKRKLAA